MSRNKEEITQQEYRQNTNHEEMPFCMLPSYPSADKAKNNK